MPVERASWARIFLENRIVPLQSASLFWCDGHRNLSVVIHPTRMELGPADFDFVGYLRFLETHGYVEFGKG